MMEPKKTLLNKFMPNPFWSSRNLIIFTVCAVHHLTLLRINLSSLGRYRVKEYFRVKLKCRLIQRKTHLNDFLQRKNNTFEKLFPKQK